MDRKRFIYLIIFILISIGLGYLLYRVFLQANANGCRAARSSDTANANANAIPRSGSGCANGRSERGGVLPTAGRAIQTPGAQRQAPIKTLTKDPVTGARADKSGR